MAPRSAHSPCGPPWGFYWGKMKCCRYRPPPSELFSNHALLLFLLLKEEAGGRASQREACIPGNGMGELARTVPANCWQTLNQCLDRKDACDIVVLLPHVKELGTTSQSLFVYSVLHLQYPLSWVINATGEPSRSWTLGLPVGRSLGKGEGCLSGRKGGPTLAGYHGPVAQHKGSKYTCGICQRLCIRGSHRRALGRGIRLHVPGLLRGGQTWKDS